MSGDSIYFLYQEYAIFSKFLKMHLFPYRDLGSTGVQLSVSENTAMLSVKARFQSKPPVARRVVWIALKQNHSFTGCIMFNIFAKNYTFEENSKIHEQRKITTLLDFIFGGLHFRKFRQLSPKFSGNFHNSLGKQHIKQHDLYLLISIIYFYNTIIFIDDTPSVSFLLFFMNVN